MSPIVCETIQEWHELRTTLCSADIRGQGWGFVPTMGNLHSGHLSLVRAAREHHARVVVSVFVNPTQFERDEDFARYPRTLEADLAVLQGLADVVFCPHASVLYPPEDTTRVILEPLSSKLLGHVRPGHFYGVTTVVCKLLNIIAAEAAYFGEKDYQQLFLIKRMMQDLFLPTRIVGLPTVREADGLAMSSRNRYLRPAARQAARVLWQALQVGQQRHDNGATVGEVVLGVQQCLVAEPLAQQPRVDLCCTAHLKPLPHAQPARAQSCVLMVYASFEDTLLIDQQVLSRTI